MKWRIKMRCLNITVRGLNYKVLEEYLDFIIFSLVGFCNDSQTVSHLICKMINAGINEA